MNVKEDIYLGMYEVVAIMYGDRSYAFKSHPYYIDSISFIIKKKFSSQNTYHMCTTQI